jgi:hypothetical protein
MQLYQLLDIAVSLSNRLDTHWTLFISVHLALIGGIIYVDRPLQKPEKIAALLVYTGFAAVNFIMMLNQSNFLNSVYADIMVMQNAPCCVNSEIIQHITQMSENETFTRTIWSLVIIHLVMYLLVCVSILKDKALSNPSAQNNP